MEPSRRISIMALWVKLSTASPNWSIYCCQKDIFQSSPASALVKNQPIITLTETRWAAVAIFCRAERLVFLTDVPGVLDAEKKVIPSLTRARMEELRASG